jgi:hypothetical protein
MVEPVQMVKIQTPLLLLLMVLVLMVGVAVLQVVIHPILRMMEEL